MARSRSSFLPSQQVADLLATVVTMLVIAGPEIFTRNGFGKDFTNHLWLVGVQEHAIATAGVPTFFLNQVIDGIFYPFFMFYGGTLYAIGGAVSWVLGGSALVGYTVLSAAAIAAAYGGMVWLARECGVRRWAAHAPALAFAASAYYVTDIYARGDWPEFMAISMIPLAAASAWRLLGPRPIRLHVAAAFTVSVVILAGSHNITLLFVVLIGLITIVVLVLPQGRSVLPAGSRVALLVVLVVLALGVDAWYLLPNLAYLSHTLAAIEPLPATVATLDRPGVIFDPGRWDPVATSAPGLYMQMPVVLLAWGLTVLAVCARAAQRHRRLAAASLLVVLAIVLVTLTVGPIWAALPRLIRDAQFPYRLNAYVAILIGLFTIVAARMWQEAPPGPRNRLLGAGLGLAMAFSIGICVWQLWIPKISGPGTFTNDTHVFVSTLDVPSTWYENGQYHDASTRLIPISDNRTLAVNPDRITGDHLILTVHPPAGIAPFDTNIAGGPYAVAVGGGLTEIGRSTTGGMVLARRQPGSGPVSLTLNLASNTAVVAGRWLTFASLIILVAFALAFSAATLGRRDT